MSSSRRLAAHILAAMLAGAVAGCLVYSFSETAIAAQQVADYLSILTDVFLRLIKMIIAPLVFATLVTGIAHMRDGTSLGRMGLRTLLWFVTAGLVSIVLGIVFAQALKPGVGLNLSVADSDAAAIAAPEFDVRSFITNIVPSSIFDAMATNEILQIVVFSLFAGVALSKMGESASPLVRGVDALVDLMLKITDYVMLFAPLAVFAAIAAAVATQGPSILATYGKFVVSFYFALVVLWMLLAAAAWVVLGRSALILLPAIREPLMLAFATASSEAAYPKTLEQLDRVGVPRRIASFVLPLGYSFNLDGSMMYCAFALIFIAQVYGIELGFAEQLTMLLLVMVASKGMAGVPRASLIVVAASLGQFGLPEAGVLLILGIDQFLDMGRTATNVVGNSIAAAVVAKWEGFPLDPDSESGQAPDSQSSRR